MVMRAVPESFRRRRVHERKLHIMRMLLATRHIPADGQYNAAINLIPAEFNKQKEVIDAWRKYHELVRQQPTVQAAIDDHQRRLTGFTEQPYISDYAIRGLATLRV